MGSACLSKRQLALEPLQLRKRFACPASFCFAPTMGFGLLIFLAFAYAIFLNPVIFFLAFCCLAVLFLQSPGATKAPPSSENESSAKERAREDVCAAIWITAFWAACAVTAAILRLSEKGEKGTGTAEGSARRKGKNTQK